MDNPREAIGPNTSRGSVPVFLRKPKITFVIFQRDGGPDPPVPTPLDPPAIRFQTNLWHQKEKLLQRTKRYTHKSKSSISKETKSI